MRPSISHSSIRRGVFSCVYCGGSEVGNTVDHMPPTSIFRDRLRPNQLIFPSCDRCRQGTRDFDCIASWLSRVYCFSDDRTAKRESEEFLKLGMAIKKHYPAVIECIDLDSKHEQEHRRSGHALPDGAGVVHIGGPIVDRALSLFTARAGFALHWLRLGRIVPKAGLVMPFWYTNINKIAGDIPSQLLECFPGFETLKQGIKDVEDQFGYASQVLDDDGMSLHILAFRFSFLCVAFVFEDSNGIEWTPSAIHPGEFYQRYPFGVAL